ncbi:MAG: J domain-containing protein [Actinobacteria bacterium]|nr:J domain-containing protein [Actinomycetota bacterium]
MATTERDLYELLGLERGASEAEVKKAFRGLARELHPDVSQEPDAEERFRAVAEAYEVLSNPETRQLYDRYGHAGLRRGGFTPTAFDLGNLGDIFSAFFGDDLFGRGGSRGAARGGDVGTVVEIELSEAFAGVSRRVDIEVATTCARCSGDGAEPGTGRLSCPTCAGSGRLQQVSRSVFGEFVRTQACSTCAGMGTVVERACSECAGAGRLLETKTLSVEIPPGIHDGQQIRLRGEGHAGAGGPAGDAYIEVRVTADERFERDGNHILSTVDLTVVQAALGATVPVPTLEGDLDLEFEPGTQPGEVRVLRGKGMPVLQRFGRGDQRVLVNVTVPRRLTDEQRSLLKRFEAQSDEDTYKRDEGFFEKLKSALR